MGTRYQPSSKRLEQLSLQSCQVGEREKKRQVSRRDESRTIYISINSKQCLISTGIHGGVAHRMDQATCSLSSIILVFAF